jgi:hypothetical protein
MALDAAGHRRPQRADVQRVLAVGLLGAAPAGMTQQIHTHRRQPVGAETARLPGDRLADPLLQLRIPAGTAGHRHRESGGATVQHHPARPIDEVQAAQTQPRQPPSRPGMAVGGVPQRDVGHARPERCVAIKQAQLLVGAQLRQQGPCAILAIDSGSSPISSPIHHAVTRTLTTTGLHPPWPGQGGSWAAASTMGAN